MIPQFNRKRLVLSEDSFRDTPQKDTEEELIELDKIILEQLGAEVSVLVINASSEMAKEITLQLTLEIPGCSITYAPTIQLAKLILSKRSVDLIVSSQTLPDGDISDLKSTISPLTKQPDLVVVGEFSTKSARDIQPQGYQFTALKRLSKKEMLPRIIRRTPPVRMHKSPLERAINDLGANLRNDLNNPLQQIVAMVFVAQKTGEIASSTTHALDAIERAARNMASVVEKIETTISSAVAQVK